MRDGKVVFTTPTADTNPRQLAREMVGREVLMDLPGRGATAGRVVLSVENLNCRNDLGLPAVEGVSFAVRAGEIVGIAGVSGNGQSELALALTGLFPQPRDQSSSTARRFAASRPTRSISGQCRISPRIAIFSASCCRCR